MAKFKVLKNNQKYMTHLGIYSNNLTEPTNEFFNSIFSYYVITLMVVSFVASVAFILKYPTDVKPSLGAFKICVAASQCVGMFLGIGLKMIKVKALHLELQGIVDEEEDHNEVHNIYWECEKKSRKYTRRFGYFVFFHTSTFTIVLIYAFICIAFGRYDTSSWYLSLYMVFPFDDTTVRGWLMAWIIQFSAASCYALTMTSITSYFVSCCFYIDAMFDHFDFMIDSVSTNVEQMQIEKNPRKINKIHQQIIAKLSNAITFHNKIHEIFHMLEDICSVSVFSLIPANAIFLSISMYDLEVSLGNFDAAVMLFDISCILCGLFWPAFLSHSATHATDKISSIGDTVYNSNWPEYPTELQKHVLLIIARSQQPVYFTGLGIIRCTLENFGKLCKTSSSYYIMFRAIDQR